MQENSEAHSARLKKLSNIPVVGIVGPTGAGKTALAIRLSQKLNAEIISCDSRAVYKNTRALTAVPVGSWRGGMYRTKEGVICHLVDFLSPRVRWNAHDFAQEARALTRRILTRGKRVIVAGGTGLYYRAYTEGLSPLPGADPIIRAKLEKKLERHGVDFLARELKLRDPETAANTDLKNPRRVVRALELVLKLGGPLKTRIEKPQPLSYPHKTFYLSWNSETLKKRLAGRAQELLPQMKKEVTSLRRSYGTKAPAWEALLAEPLWRYIKGENTRDETIEACAQADYAYAKRQVTWFKKEKNTTAIDMSRLKGSLAKAEAMILKEIS